jgi:A/G-specific adenine glycosylase
MLALPGTDWGVDQPLALPFEADWRYGADPVRHGFTHFELELTVALAEAPVRLNQLEAQLIRWVPRAAVQSAGLPTLFARAAALALSTSPQAETL